MSSKPNQSKNKTIKMKISKNNIIKNKYSIMKNITTKLITCYPDETVYDASKKMAQNTISTIIIIDKKIKTKVLGILTERDIVKRVISKNISVTEVLEKVMTKSPVSADINSSDIQISKLMTENKVKKIIITKQNKLYGIITQTDLIKVISEKYL